MLLNKTTATILGIDPGFGRLGYSIIEADKNKEPKIIDCACFETSAKLRYEERLLLIAKKIKELLKKHRPNAMAIEKIFFSKNQKTAIQIAETRGIIIYLAASLNIPIAEYSPPQIKMALCGYGKATKTQMRKMLTISLKNQTIPKIDDATDALAISLTCAFSNVCP